MKMADQIRAAIRTSEESLSEIGRQSGVPQPMITRFMRGEGITLATAQKLADHFGLELRPAKKAGKK